MKKFGTKARNTIAIALIFTFAFMLVPIQHMIYAEENPQSTQETQNKGYLESYTEMYGWEQVEGIRPLTQQIQNKRTRSARSADTKATEVQYLAILIEFPDADMQDIHLDDAYTLKAADMVVNSGGVNIQPLDVEIPVVSLKNYLTQYSYGAFRTHTSFYPKNDAGTTISYTSKKPRTYYMKKTASNPDGYTPDQQASREEELLEEVLQAVKPSIEKELNGAQLDTNNDGFIDAISFMVEGKFSDSGIGWNDLLWSHKADRIFSTTISGKTVGAYNLNNVGDSQSPGGVFSYRVDKTQAEPLDTLKLNRAGYSVIHHEFLHTLGLPDLYRGTSIGEPVGFYDIMASNNSQNPQAMLSVLSHDWLGWGSKLSEITADRQITIQRPKYQDSNEVTAYKIYSPFHDKEYFVVEYYQKQDATHNTGRDNGLIVYRVNSTLYTNMGGTTDGLGDFLYVFRPEETSLGAAAGNLKDAVILPTVGNTYGKTIDETGDTWDKDTLYYSNGKNSGIKLEVTASDADSITLNVTVPQVQGSGTKDDPFLVSSVDDWNLLVRDNKYIKIMKDIDFNHTAITPIDNFSGHIDGNGKTLSNMTVNGSGIFESISGGSVKNLTLANVNVTGSERGHAGGFAGTISGGNIENVVLTSGTVTGGNGANGVGGFVGYLAEGASIKNSFSSLTVSHGQNVGGFIGLTTGGKVENSFANGQVQKTANSNSGGFYGSLFVGSPAPTFTGCAYDMRATGQNTADNQGDIAGITGYQSLETITLDIGGTNETDIDVVTKPILQSINSNIRLGSTAIANFDHATQKLYGISEGNTTLYIDVIVGTNQMPLTTQVQVTNTGTPTNPITGVSVTPNTLQLESGSTSTLTATITPANTTDSKTVVWSSDNEMVADVDRNGQVTAKNVGTATITATTSNGLKSTCLVTVKEKSAAQSVILDGYYEIRSAVSGKNLEVYGVSTQGGAKITQWYSTGGKNQKWKVENQSDGSVRITNVNSGLVLDYNGTADCYEQWDWHGRSNQRWEISKTDTEGNYYIRNQSNGYAMDVLYGTMEDGQHVVSYEYNGGVNQQWQFIETDPDTTQVIPDGYYEIKSAVSGKNLEVYGVSTQGGAKITQWDSTGGNNQKWKLENQSDGTIRLINVNSGYVLDYNESANSYEQWDWHGGLNQRWQISKSQEGNYYIRSMSNNHAMDVLNGSTDNGQYVVDYEYNGGINQQWQLVPTTVEQVIPDGYYEIRSAVSGKNLEVYGVSTLGGAKITQWYATGGKNQKWKVENQSDGSVRITNVNSGLVLDYNGTADCYEQWDWHGRSNQRWEISKTDTEGNYYIRNQSNGYAMDVLYGTMEDGQHVVSYEYNGGVNQQWQFIETDPDTTQVIPDGYYEIKSAVSGKNLEVYGVSTQGGAKITQWDSTGGNNQKWKLENQSDGTIRLTNVNSGLVLDYNGTADSYEQWDWHGGANQRWQISKSQAGNYYIRNMSNNHAMDLWYGSMNNGQYVVDYEYNGGINQQWKLVSV